MAGRISLEVYRLLQDTMPTDPQTQAGKSFADLRPASGGTAAGEGPGPAGLGSRGPGVVHLRLAGREREPGLQDFLVEEQQLVGVRVEGLDMTMLHATAEARHWPGP